MREIKQSRVVEGSNILYRMARDNLSGLKEVREPACTYIGDESARQRRWQVQRP